MSITKSTATIYKVRNVDDFGWADITIDSGFSDDGYGSERNHFRISISSDYGNWAYFWSHPGDNWRKFLCEVSIDYVAGKFGCDTWFDIDKTVEALKSRIVADCRENRKVTHAARDAFEAIDAAASDFYRNRTAFEQQLIESVWVDYWRGYWYDNLSVIESISPQFKAFWQGPWQHFISELKKEIEDAK